MFNASRFAPLVLSALALECLAGGPTLVLSTEDLIDVADPGMSDFEPLYLRLAQVGPSGDVAFTAETAFLLDGFFFSEFVSGVIPRGNVGDREAIAFTRTGMPIEGAPPLTFEPFPAPLRPPSFTPPTMTRVGRTGGALISGTIGGADGTLATGLLRPGVGPIVLPASCDDPPATIAAGYDGVANTRRFVLTDNGRTLALATRGCVSDIGFDRAVVEERAGHVTEFLAPGDPAPGAPGETVGLIRLADFNRAGQVAIIGGIDDPEGSLSGITPTIWTGTPGAVSILVRSGDPAPGIEGEVFMLSDRRGSGDAKDVAIHSDGEVSFIARTNVSQRGAYRTVEGAPVLIARNGDPAPGTSGFFDSISAVNTFLEPAGPDATAIFTVWRTTHQDTNDPPSQGVWLSRGQDLELLLRNGDTLSGDRVVRTILFHSGAPDGNVSIVARVSSTLDPEADRSLVLFAWSPVDEELRVVAEQELDLGLGPAIDFDIEDFFDPDAGLAENGHIVYRVRRLDAQAEFGIVDEIFLDRLPSTNDGACAADFDGDGAVDMGDFGAFGMAFGAKLGDDAYLPRADIDADGDVDLGDFGTFGAQFGRTDCGT